ncbi:FimV/HubP family polar landmark protein [Colwellia sp. RSH04]|uniref:FimV/HubP family polar landmark protein n=1 Tax=Colwellia sp. RSH04 TaxID=2305464 RepID=UPI000E5953EA|nr:FimV/HubP family polar landmark protein [Colwellia sp. RSH04]RHW74733.1 hypothetical protein D1094_17490 [Colwellia sp. RSH04]
MTFQPYQLFISVLLLALVSFSCIADVIHLSLHNIESAPKRPLIVKLNIVEKEAKPLKFSLVNQNVESPLQSERLNDFMIKLTSPHYISGAAAIHVYEQSNNRWMQIDSISLTDSNETENLTEITQNKHEHLTQKQIEPTVIVSPLSINSQNCLLTRQAKETLWSIASRYKESLKLDTYSTIIAIYNSNMSQFNKRHINLLRNGATLKCPSNEVLATLGSKAGMKEEFERLSQLPMK